MSPDCKLFINSDPEMRPASQQQVAEWSVQAADAILAELAKEPTP